MRESGRKIVKLCNRRNNGLSKWRAAEGQSAWRGELVSYYDEQGEYNQHEH